MIIKKKDVVLTCVFVIWFLILYIGLAAAFSNIFRDDVQYSDGFLYVLLEGICLLYVVKTPRFRYPLTIWNAVLLSLVQVTGMIIAGTDSIAVMMIRTLSWSIFMLALYKYCYRHQEDMNRIIILFVIGLIVLACYTTIQQNLVRSQIALDGGMNELYTVLLLTPFLFLLKNKFIRIVGLLSVCLMVLLSLKATAIIALSLGLLSFYIISNIIRGKKIKWWFVIGILLVIVFAAWGTKINQYLLIKLNVDWRGELSSAIGTGGSGRVDIWTETVNYQVKSNLGEWLFGHGYNTVVEKVKFSAHNDFLEVLYDFGLLGLGIYLSLFIMLLKRLKEMICAKCVCAPAFGMSIIMVFVVSMFSHLIIVPGLLINCAALWAICLSYFRLTLKWQNETYSGE